MTPTPRKIYSIEGDIPFLPFHVVEFIAEEADIEALEELIECCEKQIAILEKE